MATLRQSTAALYLYVHLSGETLFMGCEFGQGTEWNSNKV